ncbi:flagellar protein FlgN [Pseudothauera rhizosphaerae]|uniref:Flagellar protein FlgN n=2 Tax=Pseudothauera rhizosphaerae TaxID=2565932 RepID=A0A4S4AWR1_9RHOO|nr:flagellar protein FlgN [Pseudothauera rhizosphaerae]
MEATQLRAFVDLLQREEALLLAGDTDALLSLTQEKTSLYHTQQRLHEARVQLLKRLGQDDPAQAIHALCQDLPDTRRQWDEVLRLAAEARERNTLNGRLIVERLQHNQGALDILLKAANRPQLYDADGNPRASGSGRLLGSA